MRCMKLTKEKKHIAFCVNDEYSDYIRVPIKSIIDNLADSEDYYEIYILSEFISSRRTKRLLELNKLSKNINIQICIINNYKLKGLKTSNWDISAWYRILLPEILSKEITKVLYLDADTLVLKNLSCLFSMDMINKSIAAVIDYQNLFNIVFDRCGYEKTKGYICSGVMMMNLSYWRENNLTEKIISWAMENENKLRCPDQDAINYICRDSKIILPMKYGIMDSFLTNPIFQENGYSAQIKDCIYNPVIIHYNGKTPWYKEYKKHTFNKEWEKYNNLLDKPVKRHYQARGILKFKIIIYNLFKFRKLMINVIGA